MRALNTRLRKIEKAILPDCENCRYKRFENLTDAELKKQGDDLRRRGYLVTPIDELKEELKELTEAVQRRIANGEERWQHFNLIV
jgi:hypothetical protein